MNVVSQVTAQMATELLDALAPSYADLIVRRGLFRPASLPVFSRYAIIVAPNIRPWEERRNAIANIQYVVRLELYLLVKNWEQTDTPLFGDQPGALGLFELVNDTKDLLRISDLDGLLDKTYDEPGGDSAKQGPGALEFQDTIPGFDGDEYAFVHRARIPYLARTVPFCHPRLIAGTLVVS
jgi:hypothetical protein